MNPFKPLIPIGVALFASLPRWALAEDVTRPVDVTIAPRPIERRHVSIEFNPLSLVIGKVSGNVVVAPVDHHAIVLNPFYSSNTTIPISIYDSAGNQTQLPTQSFRGFGVELGYRYYLGRGGPRGLFAGPSLVLASFTGTAQNGTETPFIDYGVAADVGYQALILDRVSLSLGAGLQFLATSKSIPNQQFPVDLYANSGVQPRLLASIGCAF